MPYFIEGRRQDHSRINFETRNKRLWRQEFRKGEIDPNVKTLVAYFHAGGNSGSSIGGSKYDPTMAKDIMRKNPTDKAWFDFCK